MTIIDEYVSLDSCKPTAISTLDEYKIDTPLLQRNRFILLNNNHLWYTDNRKTERATILRMTGDSFLRGFPRISKNWFEFEQNINHHPRYKNCYLFLYSCYHQILYWKIKIHIRIYHAIKISCLYLKIIE